MVAEGRPDRAPARARASSSAGISPRRRTSSRSAVLDAAGGDVRPVDGRQARRRPALPSRRSSGARTARASTTATRSRPKKPTDDPKNDLVSVRLDGTGQAPVPALPRGRRHRAVARRPVDRLHLARQRLRHGDARRPAEGAARGLAEGGRRPRLPPLRRRRRLRALGRRRARRSRGRSRTRSTACRSPAAIDFAREERRKAEEKAKKEEAKKDDARHGEGEGREGEGEGPGVARPEVRDDRDRADRAARRRPTARSCSAARASITMKGDEVLENADVLVTGNRIAAVGPAGTLSSPRRREDLRRPGRDDHPRLHRHARAPALLGLRALPGGEVGVRREPRLRRHDGLRPLRAVARRLRAGRGRRGRADGRAAHLLVGRRPLRRPAGRTSSPRSTTSTTRSTRSGG